MKRQVDIKTQLEELTVSYLYDSVIQIEQNDQAILNNSASTSANPLDGPVIMGKRAFGYKS